MSIELYFTIQGDLHTSQTLQENWMYQTGWADRGLESTGAIRQIDEEKRKGGRTIGFAAIILTMTKLKFNRILNKASERLISF